ncbi:MAG: methyltransferase domain-containing protein [Acidobacteria bacterium]|nr:methyltransferase domain-containing protein [Acidobacteriota bacterium]
MRIPFSTASRFLAALFPRRLMRRDWDLRARSDAASFIDCGHGASAERFWKSGEEDVAAQVLKNVRLRPDAQVLEIGCGIGRLMKAMRRRARVVTGVDISGEMIERARRELLPDDGVRLFATDGDLREIPDRSIDFVYSFIVFQHIPSRAAVLTYLREAARVLRPGGLFRFQADGRGPRFKPPNTWSGVRFRSADLRRRLDELGLGVLEITAAGTQYMWVTARRERAAGETAPAAAAFSPRRWNAAALDSLLRRLDRDPAKDAPRVVSGEIDVRDLVSPLLRRGRRLDPADYVDRAYRAILGRSPDPEGLAAYAREIQEGIPRAHVVDCLIASPEFDAMCRENGAEPAGGGASKPV